MCHGHPLSDPISEKNGRTKKLNLNYYGLKHGLSHGMGITRLAAFLFEKTVQKSGAHEWNRQINGRTDGQTEKFET